MGDYKVFKNPMIGYEVGRVIDESKPIHSGNIEYYGSTFLTKANAQEVADRLIKETK